MKIQTDNRGFIIVCELLILTTLMAVLTTLLIVSEVTQRTVKDINSITNGIPGPDFNIRHKLWNVGTVSNGLIVVNIPDEEIAGIGQWRIFRTFELRGTNTVWEPVASDYCDRLSAVKLMEMCRDASMYFDGVAQTFFKAEKDAQP